MDFSVVACKALERDPLEGLQESPAMFLGLVEDAGPWSFLLPPHPFFPAYTAHQQLAFAACCQCHPATG